MRRAFAVGLAVVVGLPLLAGCSRTPVRPGEARVDPHGVVEVMEAGGQYQALKSAKTVHNGDSVRVKSGQADVRLPAAELSMRDGAELVIGASPDLRSGDLLVVPLRRVTVTSAGTDFEVAGAARLTRLYAVTAASYVGSVSVRSAGSSLDVKALRQTTVAALGSVAQAAEPLQYKENDPWDRRFLADAIDLGAELQARSDGANNQFRGQGSTPGFYRNLLPQLARVPEFDAALLDGARPPGEHIVGAGIALAGAHGGFVERWRRVFSFRSEGATWGLVAMDEQVQQVAGLVRSIDDALGRAPLPGVARQLALSPPGAPSGPGPAAPTTPGTTPSNPRNPGPGDNPSPPPPTTVPPQPGIIPSPPDTGLPIDPLADDAVDTINGLLPKPGG
ncbi:MAG: hypothetical protein QOK43_2782 [Acidimicrobiaceae bacterium]|nr:hypothetical protein [Acidimicrobiaceae bacterium]